jgi:hypothetical protein
MKFGGALTGMMNSSENANDLLILFEKMKVKCNYDK